MVDVRPFKGVRYKLGQNARADDIIAPPYDIIDTQMHKSLIDRHPHNVVRLELPDMETGHPDAGDPYESARLYLEQWLDENVLIRDDEEAYYVLAQEFDYRGTHIRWGLIAAVGLEEYESKKILPHEGTMDGPKEDRFKLMDKCEANLSPIFVCYFDEEKVVGGAIERTAKNDPILEATDPDGVKIRMWKMSDKDDIEIVRDAFSKKKLYIADGHHRYETCLAYKHKMSESRPDDDDAAFNRTLMYIVDFDDPGLLIRPYHRSIRHFKGMDSNEFLSRLDEFFHITKLDIDPWGRDEENREKAADALSEASVRGPAYAAIASGDTHAYVIEPRKEALDKLDDLPPALAKLEVSILHRLAIEEVLEIDDCDLREGNLIFYDPDYRVIWRAVRDKKCAAGFFLSPLRPAHVSNVAEAGLKMPIKSTYFYPKVPSGLVFHRFR